MEGGPSTKGVNRSLQLFSKDPKGLDDAKKLMARMKEENKSKAFFRRKSKEQLADEMAIELTSLKLQRMGLDPVQKERLSQSYGNLIGKLYHPNDRRHLQSLQLFYLLEKKNPEMGSDEIKQLFRSRMNKCEVKR